MAPLPFHGARPRWGRASASACTKLATLQDRRNLRTFSGRQQLEDDAGEDGMTLAAGFHL